MTEHEAIREAALDELDSLAEEWLNAKAGGKETSAIEDRIKAADRRSRRAEEKIRRDEKRRNERSNA